MPDPMQDPTQPQADGGLSASGASDALEQSNAEDLEVQELEDGSAVVNLGGDEPPARVSEEFSENLAEWLPLNVLDSMGLDLAELVESDKRSRKERDKQYAEGIKKAGLGDDAPGGANFDGASRVTHPMLAKGCVDFMSKAIKELFPASGPCKTQIVGETTDAKLDKAERKKKYMNWQLQTKVSEQRAELERLLSQLPLGGSQYKRWWWDAALRRPRTETVYIDDVFLPYSQSDFYSSYRVTHRQWVAEDEFQSRIDSGLYIDIDVGKPGVGANEISESKEATDSVEGNEEDVQAFNEEGLREVYMIYADLRVEGDDLADGRTAPYIVHVENYSQKVLGVYRNWKEGDDGLEKKHWMVEYNFIPWRGAYGVGLYHLIGSLAGSGTGALRALLDSAHISNFPGGLKLKGGRASGQTVQVNATELAEIDAPPGVDDIRKLVMPFPFNGPSNVLMQLLEWLTAQAETVIATASESIADAGANMPVGTALALIEHGSTNFSAIHARCHASFKREMEILHRLDAENLSDKEVVAELGELVVTAEDFQGPMDIIPVSDPNIFSEAQRYAQVQAILQLAENPHFAPIFKPDRLLKRVLRTLQVPDAEELANLPKDPVLLGPVEENFVICAAEPQPIKVFMQQDHLAHLTAHLTFLTSPMFGANPLIGPVVFPVLMPHVKDHMMGLYKMHASAAADAAAMTGQAMGKPMPREHAEMQGVAFADKALATVLAPIMPIMEKAQQLAQQFAQKPPVSPDVQAQLAAQAAQAQQSAQAQQALQAQQLQAQSQDHQATLAAQAQEADKERAFKAQMEQNKLAARAQEVQAERDQEDRATTMATAVEHFTAQMQQQMEAQRAQAQADREERAAQAQLQRDQLKADNDANLAILQGMIAAQAPAPAAGEGQGTTQPDQASALQPLIEAMNQNTQQMMQQLSEGLANVQAAHAAPRVARYIKDANGNNVGVESVIKH